jgi:hypothetical protein
MHPPGWHLHLNRRRYTVSILWPPVVGVADMVGVGVELFTNPSAFLPPQGGGGGMVISRGGPLPARPASARLPARSPALCGRPAADFWLAAVVLGPAASLLPDLAILGFKRWCKPTLVTLLQVRGGGGAWG